MHALMYSLTALVCILGGTFCGMYLRHYLPEHHLSDESKDMVKLGTGMIATLGALVLGLLIASAKGNFDTVNSTLRDTGSKVIVLDRILAQYGPETAEARDMLRNGITSAIREHWPEDAKSLAAVKALNSTDTMIDLQARLLGLSPKNEAQQALKSRALQVSGEIEQARWLITEQRGMTSLPVTFLVIIVCWFTLIFTSFGLFAPRNATVIVVLVVCALSVTCSLFLIAELDHPYGGLVKVSSAPLRNALIIIGR
jgi:hypothetical protein